MLRAITVARLLGSMIAEVGPREAGSFPGRLPF